MNGSRLPLIAASLLLACNGTEPERPWRLSGDWAAILDPNPYQIEWRMALLENVETGEITGTSQQVRGPALGGMAHYWVVGTHDHPLVSLYFDTGTYTPGPTFNGEMVHPDTIRGAGESSGITFYRR